MGSDLPKEPRGPTAGVLRRTVRFSTVSRKGAESATASAESAPQRQVSNRHQTTLTLLKLKRVAGAAAFSTPEENGPPRAHKRKIGSHYENHQRAAELHDNAAHAHRSAAEAHQKQDHQTGQELSRQALEHSRQAYQHTEQAAGHALNEHGFAIFGHEDITALAHALWQARGCPEGSPQEDWFHAVQQLRDRPVGLRK